jgi:pimeloyl-ACP methyl ester carboxylesterase
MNIWDWCVDYLHLVYLQIRSLFVAHIHKRLDSSALTFVLIPGVYERWSALQFLGDGLEARGYQVLSLPELGYNRQPIPVLAQKVSGALAAHGLQRVIIVSHSKGGLVGQYILRHLNTTDVVKHVIGIATPWSGTMVGRLLRFKATAELLPTSEIIRSLAAPHETDSRITALYAEADNHIWDQPLHHPRAHNVVLPVRGHTYILFSKKLPGMIIEIANNYE